MEYIRFKIYPEGQFGSTPMSDTIFGQLCCILADSGKLEKMLVEYDKKPFAVFSDMLPLDKGRRLVFKKEVTADTKEDGIKQMLNRKEDKKKKYLSISNLLHGKYQGEELFSDDEPQYIAHEVVKNSVNRNTGSTDDAGFAPYSVINTAFSDDFHYTLYAYIEEEYIDIVKSSVELMGSFGFGRDSSTGLGKFRVDEITNVDVTAPANFNFLYTLGNCIFEESNYEDVYYELFTRFGKHGGLRVLEGKPYKNPIVMARQGALIHTNERPNSPYIGKGLTSGISYYKDTVHQGYSLYIPTRINHD